MSLKGLSQDEKWDALDKHYDRLRRAIKMTTSGDGMSLIVNGSAGMGKTEFATDIIEQHGKDTGINHGMVSGTLSAVMLFERLYKHRGRGVVLLVDDTDKILEDVESIEILKGALDTKEKMLDWSKYSQAHKSRGIPDNFRYEGKMIIVTNKQLRTTSGDNLSIAQQRLQPLQSRVSYFRAGLPNVEWNVEAIKMFASKYQSKHDENGAIYELRCFRGVDQNVQNEIISWIEKEAENIREVSFRTVAKLVKFHQQEPKYWSDLALSDMLS